MPVEIEHTIQMKQTSRDYYARLAELIATPFSAGQYYELYGMMRQLCEDFSGDRVFSNFFSQLGYVCDMAGVSKTLAAALQSLRRRVGHVEEIRHEDFPGDVRIVADFVKQLFGSDPPDELLSSLPDVGNESTSHRHNTGVGRVLRVRVLRSDTETLYVQPDSDDILIRVSLTAPEDRRYLLELVHEGSTLNLLDVSVGLDGIYIPQWIIYEPDYLLSPSDLAGVFEPNAITPHYYFLKMLQPRESTYYTLLGNTSGQFLDDIIFRRSTATYADSLRKAFRNYPLDFYLQMRSTENISRFHNEARVQFANISHIVEQQMEAVYGFDLRQALIEPSFVCPAVGLAGRMDYLEVGGYRLIEQKSGKRDEYRNSHKEQHFVQMMLYQLMIEYTLGLSRDECRAFLLYSRYSDGLMIERPYMALLHKAIEMRNRIVAMQEKFAENSASCAVVFEQLDVDALRQRPVNDKLWMGYLRPRLETLLRPFTVSLDGQMPAKAFFFRFYSFLAMEQWLSRMGVPSSGAHGYADLWNNPALVRVENGDMYAGLHILAMESAVGDDGIDTITFGISADQQDKLTNFRTGDAVQIYSYEGLEPNVARQFTLRGKVVSLGTDKVKVVLNNAQRNMAVFGDAQTLFALEHDRVESGSSNLVAGLYSLLTAPKEIQNRFFLHTLPGECSTGLPVLLGNYGSFDELVQKEVAAQEIFLVIGPPGSGKTSCALRYMVEEELRRSPSSRLLLMAYTNRAVDELCGMLEGIISDTPMLLSDYLRIGHALSADEAYRHRMLAERVGDELKTVTDIGNLLNRTRIIVGTTTTMMQRQQLLREMHFEVAFVDEASQILEPYLLSFFTLGVIDKFVLVGDQKQLPAVVQQNADVATIDDESLRSLGFTNCGRSLFDRMLHRLISLGRNDLYMQILTQGRMHPRLYDFVNRYFYSSRLQCVPLAHQQRDFREVFANLPANADNMTCHLAEERISFIDCVPVEDGVNEKVNSAEAGMVASCLSALSALYEANGRELKADDVGIIVPYRNQISMIRAKLHEKGLNRFMQTTIDTVERYQGSQRDIIIYSFTVRHPGQLHFLTSSVYMETDNASGTYAVDRKLNVALTRAREQLILIGNYALLQSNEMFARLLDSVPRIG
ncbi:MAG: ATP-dependent helicase [Bacteroidaceae bacterium]|nr:ATP-dependent helicase [Bacteroidaceae bacterium]